MSDAIRIEPLYGAKSGSRDLDGRIAELSRRQHGVVSRAQLLELGLGRRAIFHRVERRRLHPIHSGVYAVGHPLPSREGRWLAAVLAGGAGAVLSHRSAAALWGVRPSARALVEVSVPRGGSRPGIQFHRAAPPPDELTVHHGIPVTTVPRTLLDLAAVVKERELERGINEAEVLRLWDELSLDALLERYPRRAGSSALRAAMARRREGATVTRSELEERFLALIRASPLPSPELNAPIRGYEADFLWRDQRLIVEVDGRAAHATATAFERDRERDRSLAAAGWRTARITWRQLNETPATVLHHLLALVESG